MNTTNEVNEVSEINEEKIYEKAINVKRVEVTKDAKGNETIVLVDTLGARVVVTNRHAINRLYYLLGHTSVDGLRPSQIRALDPPQQEKLMTAKAHKRNLNDTYSRLKVMFDSKGNPISVATVMHKSFNWAEIMQQIKDVIRTEFGDAPFEQLGDNIIFRLPVKNKYVSSWLNITRGNNLIMGASAVRMNTRFRTEFDTVSRGGRAPCMNWANLWQLPTKIFVKAIEDKPLNSVYSVLGIEDVNLLNAREIHFEGTQINSEALTISLKSIVAALEKLLVVIDDSVTNPLKKAEMSVILHAYNVKIGLPKYVIKLVLDNVQEETVWGFSQAASYVRTHSELRDVKDRGREYLGNTHKLENIAAEVLSLSPTIESIHRQVGDITEEVLMKPAQSIGA